MRRGPSPQAPGSRGVVQLTRALADEYLERGKIRTPLGNAQPDEVAALIAFIASDEGRYMTGAIVSIDGGLTM